MSLSADSLSLLRKLGAVEAGTQEMRSLPVSELTNGEMSSWSDLKSRGLIASVQISSHLTAILTAEGETAVRSQTLRAKLVSYFGRNLDKAVWAVIIALLIYVVTYCFE